MTGKFDPKKLLLIVFLLLGVSAYCQDNENHAKWSAKVNSLTNGEYELVFTASIDAGWYIYDTKEYKNGPNSTSFKFELPDGVSLVGGVKEKSKATVKYDEIFMMDIGHFSGKPQFVQKIKYSKDKKVAVKAVVEWQACNDESCTAPTEEEFFLEIEPQQNQTLITDDSQAVDTASTAGIVEASEEKIDSFPQAGEFGELASKVEEATAGGSLWALIIEAILWGFAALLTPCVFPMVPMTVSFFLKQSENKTKGRALATIYGVSIVLLYTLPIAVMIGITYFFGGENVTADIFNWIATHWVPNVIFFVIFMLFAASFFGAFEIVMPSWLVNKSDAKSDKGGIVGTFFMALTLVLVSFSCTGPIVGTVIIKSTQGEIWNPVITMLAFSVAFALPFTLFAFFPSMIKSLPKSGGWLNSVKVVLGFLELALGLKFLSVADQTYHWGILDREVYLALWIVIFALLGFYLLGKIRFAHDSKIEHIGVGRLSLAIITFSFVIYMIPGMWGAPLKALSGYLPPIHTLDFNLNKVNAVSGEDQTSEKIKYSDFLAMPHGLNGYFDYQQGIEKAKKEGKPVMLDFTGHGCVNCRQMEATVLSDKKIQATLNDNFIVIALYVDDRKELEPEDWVEAADGRMLRTLGKVNVELALSKFGVNSQPTYILIDPFDERRLAPNRALNTDVNAFYDWLQSGLNDFLK